MSETVSAPGMAAARGRVAAPGGACDLGGTRSAIVEDRSPA